MVVFNIVIPALIVVIGFFAGIRIVRPDSRGLIERMGDYKGLAQMGFNWIIPFIDRLIPIDITETMVDAEQQEVITKDNLNIRVDAQIYYKVMTDETSLKATQYNVFNYRVQIINLTRTTLRNIMGTMTLTEANRSREVINTKILEVMEKEIKNWGIEITKAELKDIIPPKNVQDAMNNVVIAENQKIAAVDLATATATEADGERQAKIKEAEGNRQRLILEAEGRANAVKIEALARAEAIKAVNMAAKKYFTGNAQILKKLEVTEAAMKDNAKMLIPGGKNISTVVTEMAGCTPIPSPRIIRRE